MNRKKLLKTEANLFVCIAGVSTLMIANVMQKSIIIN